MSTESVRGAARSRGGATDTTMLIWKVIAASPGIIRARIWERVEHDIPPGYATRLYSNERARHGKSIAHASAIDLARARGYVLTLALINLREKGNVSWDGEGNDRRYMAARPPVYRGNPDMIDESGTRAAEHMALAEALRVVEKALAQGRPPPSAVGGHGLRLRGKLFDAVEILAKTVRART